MARKSKRPPLPKEAQWVQLINAFRAEPAWKALSPWARLIYVEIKSRFTLQNNGRLEASVRWVAGEVGCSKATAERSLLELQAHGFIVQMQGGYLGCEGRGKGTLWRLTELGYLDERPTKDYQRWLPENKIPSSSLGQGVRKSRTVRADRVLKSGTGRPNPADSSGPKSGGACPSSEDDLHYAKGGGEQDVLETTTTVGDRSAASSASELRSFAVVINDVVARVGVRSRHGCHPFWAKGDLDVTPSQQRATQ